VHARFVFQPRISTASFDHEDDLFVSTNADIAGRKHINCPTAGLSIVGVDAEKVSRKDGSLVASGASADFHDHIAVIARVFGQKQRLDLAFQAIDERFQVEDLGLSQQAHIFVIRIQDGVCFLDAIEGLAVLARFFDQWFQIDPFFVQLSRALVVVAHFQELLIEFLIMLFNSE